MGKINTKGEYTRHPGVTVIARIREEDSSLWTSLRQNLVNSVLCEHFSFTPVESYHMTAINLFTEHGVGSGRWKKFLQVNADFFRALNLELKFDESIDAQVVNLKITNGGTISLVVQPSSEQMEVYDNIAEKFGISNGRPRQYHITLGHCFKPMDPEIHAEVVSHFKRKLAIIFPNTSRAFKLNPPKLHHFEDMTQFVPWDGSSLTWLTSSRYSVNAFFSTHFPSPDIVLRSESRSLDSHL